MAVSASQNISLDSTITVTHAGTGYFYRSSNTASTSRSFSVSVPSGATNISATLYYNYNSSYSGATVNGVACSQGAGYIHLGAVSSANVSFSFKAYAVDSQGGLPSATTTRTASWSAYLAVTWDGDNYSGNPGGGGTPGEPGGTAPPSEIWNLYLNGVSGATAADVVYTDPGAAATLSWSADDTNIAVWQIHRKINGGAYAYLESIAWQARSATVYAASAGNMYQYMVLGIYSNNAEAGYAYSPTLISRSAVRAPTWCSVSPSTRYPGELATLTWGGALGGAGTYVTGYHIYQNGVYLAEVPGTSYIFAAPAAGSYAYQVYAISNISGYNSGPSPAAGLTVENPRSTGTVSYGTGSSAEMDGTESVSIAIVPSNATYTHKVIWYTGLHSVEEALAVGVTSATLDPVPLEWCNAFTGKPPYAANVKLETYDGETKVGEYIYPISVTVPASILPTATEITATVVPNGAPVGIERLVQGYSKCDVAIVGAAGAYGSTIASYAITDGGALNAASDTATFGPFSVAREITFTGTATDTRGRTVSVSAAVTVYPYFRPSLKDSSIFRSDINGTADNGGAYARLKATSVIASIDGQNTSVLEGRVYPRGGTPGAFETMASAVASVLGGGLLSAYQTYIGEIRVTDLFGFVSSYGVLIPTETIGFHALDKGLGAAVGKYCETAGMFQIPDDWTTNIKLGNINGEGKVGTTADLTLMTGAGGLVVARTMAEAISIWKFTNPNLLHNWDFRNPVNQRGTTGNVTTNVYFYDRWFLATYPSMLITVNANYLTLSGGCELAQFIEGLRLKGKVVTASIKVNGSETVLFGTATFPTTDTGSATITIAGFGTIVIHNLTDRHAISIRPTSTVNVECVKLELGTVSTLAYDPPMNYGTELLKCQRYLQLFKGTGSSTFYGYGHVIAAGTAILFVPLLCQMRIVPTLAVSGTFYAEYAEGISKAITGLSMTAQSTTNNTSTIWVMATMGAMYSTGTPVFLVSAPEDFITLSADL